MQKVLIVHTGGGIGDVLLSTPVIHALKHQWPDSQIDFLARASTAGALRNHPQLHEIMTIDSTAPRLTQLPSWIRRIRAKQYEAAIVLWSRTNLAWMLYLAGVKRRIGQDSRMAYSWTYTDRVSVRSEHGDFCTHWCEIMLDYVRCLIPQPLAPKPLFVIPEAAKAEADKLLNQLPDGQGPIIGFHSTKGMQLTTQSWPVEAFANYVRALVQQLHARVILTGSESERPLVDQVAQLSQVELLNLAGQTSLDTLAAVASRCQAFVCPDSGPMHLASIVGTPVVGIYALAEDFPKRWAPVEARSRILTPEKRQCQKRCIKALCPDFNCYNDVTAQQVVEAVDGLLKG